MSQPCRSGQTITFPLYSASWNFAPTTMNILQHRCLLSSIPQGLVHILRTSSFIKHLGTSACAIHCNPCCSVGALCTMLPTAKRWLGDRLWRKYCQCWVEIVSFSHLIYTNHTYSTEVLNFPSITNIPRGDAHQYVVIYSASGATLAKFRLDATGRTGHAISCVRQSAPQYLSCHRQQLPAPECVDTYPVFHSWYAVLLGHSSKTALLVQELRCCWACCFHRPSSTSRHPPSRNQQSHHLPTQNTGEQCQPYIHTQPNARSHRSRKIRGI